MIARLVVITVKALAIFTSGATIRLALFCRFRLIATA